VPFSSDILSEILPFAIRSRIQALLVDEMLAVGDAAFQKKYLGKK